MNISEFIQNLDANTAEIISVLDSCNEKELTIVPENKWSIIGISEHILLTEKIVLKLLFHPAEKKSEKEEIYGSEKLNKLIIQFRARKVKAPDNLHPKGDIKSVQEFKTELLKLRSLLKDGLNSNRIKIDNSVYTHPYLGEMTVSDWLYFIPAHTKRHTDQISDHLIAIRKENTL